MKSLLLKSLGVTVTMGATMMGTMGSLQAATVTKTFTANVLTGTYAGQSATGSFTYDDALLSGVGEETLDANDGLTLSITFLGQTYTELNDIDFSSFPEISFLDGNLVEIDYIVSESDPNNPTNILQPGILALNLRSEFTPGTSTDLEAVLEVVESTPEPTATLGILALGILGTGSVLKQRSRR